MRLAHIQQLTGTIVLKTGLHIGAGDSEMRIGTDNPVVRDPFTGQPYIPGSSLKGRMRALLEWRHGLVSVAQGQPFSLKHLQKADSPAARNLLKLFGSPPEADTEALAEQIGPTRLAFWDCPLDAKWKESEADSRNLPTTETKSENIINRITGAANHPRFMERVVAGAQFEFRLTLKVLTEPAPENLLEMLLQGLKLLEADSLGGSGSRGYGKIKFNNLHLDGQSLQEQFDATHPFAEHPVNVNPLGESA